MPLIALPADYDGRQICLDESFPLARNQRLIVTILPDGGERDGERGVWLRFSQSGLEAAGCNSNMLSR
ncbi:MAG: hypothetical protein CO095_07815 [Armatimonadetes bacterium CG_4_9_14_3_um_filter_58_7]|nr:MAG: hypothetical protein CO095_07815 [Armatimonadetes bacterium CG_4_9_14_3_um_filter_58_7]